MKPVKADVHFPTLEAGVLKFWKDNGLIEKGLKANEGGDPFIFYDGPPFATGLPHYGHILAGTLKDIVPRYWVLKGKYVERRWGWDCHGLPVEFELENELNLAGRSDIERYGVAKFNEACRGIVQRYAREWQQVIERTGRWVDFKNNYRTMDLSFMESVWWVFKQLWDKGLIFEGHRVMPYSWRISTPLSNFEAGLNYKDVQDPALTVRFKAVGEADTYFLAWTTTPWTLPSNLALTVHPEVDYQEVSIAGEKERYILAGPRLGAYFEGKEITVHANYKGSELKGRKYEPLFPFAKDTKNAFQVCTAEYVTTGDGTGIVHTAPAFGEDDFNVGKANGIGFFDPVDREGKFTKAAPEYAGQQVKEADKSIIRDLKAKGAIYKHDTLVHSYPFCWRSDTPLIYKAISTWFVALEPIKKQLVKNNQKTHWVPETLRDGRFGNWLENARDWNISRNRFWGTPLPIWKCSAECGAKPVCLGSIQELEEKTKQKVTDLHKHYVDEMSFPCAGCKAPMKRIEEVLDCWFESGSMPYAQQHYPFENKKRFEENFPAHFIAEGVDQTRGWFYTLSVLSTALFDKPPFQNVIVNGLVLAEDGKKMSKRLKNYPDPGYILDTYGADALRAYLTTSPAAHAQDLRFSESGVKEVIRSVLLPYWNAYSFFVTYALAEGWKPTSAEVPKVTHEMDRWVLSRLMSLVKNVDERMADYHLYEVVPEVVRFIEDLTNWYIRLNRRRFWEGKNHDSFATLYFVLVEFSKVLAPILPFVTEEVFQNLRLPKEAESIHISRFPAVRAELIDAKLEQGMALAERIVALGRTARSENKLKNRQPLAAVEVIVGDAKLLETVKSYASLIAGELNVKDVAFSSNESEWVTITAKPNWKEIGRIYGAKAKERAKAIESATAEELKAIPAAEYVIRREPKKPGVIQTEGNVTLWLDTNLTAELIGEGRAREIVNRIQKLRKDKDFQVTDRIKVRYEAAGDLAQAITRHQAYIADEVLAASFETGGSQWDLTEDIDGLTLKVSVSRI
jgi:isoleucyl-tRNA synthetase